MTWRKTSRPSSGERLEARRSAMARRAWRCRAGIPGSHASPPGVPASRPARAVTDGEVGRGRRWNGEVVHLNPTPGTWSACSQDEEVPCARARLHSAFPDVGAKKVARFCFPRCGDHRRRSPPSPRRSPRIICQSKGGCCASIARLRRRHGRDRRPIYRRSMPYGKLVQTAAFRDPRLGVGHARGRPTRPARARSPRLLARFSFLPCGPT